MSPRLPRITAERLRRALERDGWIILRQRGSHLAMEHPTKSGLVVIPMHGSRTLKPGTLASILQDAQLSSDDLRRLL